MQAVHAYVSDPPIKPPGTKVQEFLIGNISCAVTHGWWENKVLAL